jgi:uncharacterized protein (DUF1330 family)
LLRPKRETKEAIAGAELLPPLRQSPASTRKEKVMPAYIIFTREATKDPEEMKVYSSKAGDTLAGHPVTPRVLYGAFEMLEGDPIQGVVVLEFPTAEEARTWYHGPAYQEAVAHRHAGSDYRVFIVDGVG